MLDRDHAAAIMLTDTAANTMPSACQRVTRSRSTTIAKTTVAAGYSEIKTPVRESNDACSASSMATLAPASSTGRVSASLSGFPDGTLKLRLAAAATITSTVAEIRANNSGHKLDS